MLKIRRPLGRLIFNMGIAIPGKTVFLIETAPWIFSHFCISINQSIICVCVCVRFLKPITLKITGFDYICFRLIIRHHSFQVVRRQPKPYPTFQIHEQQAAARTSWKQAITTPCFWCHQDCGRGGEHAGWTAYSGEDAGGTRGQAYWLWGDQQLIWGISLYVLYSVRRRYKAVIFVFENPHNRHPIARPLWRDMECLLWAQAWFQQCP